MNASHLNASHLLIRQLAASLVDAASFVGVDDDTAVGLFVDVVHDGGCPGCGDRGWTPNGKHHLKCRAACGTVSVYRATPWQRRRLSTRVVLAAVFDIFVATTTRSARGFSRAEGLRLETAWKLLHSIRDALPPPPVPTDGLLLPLLGRNGDNACSVIVGAVDGAPAIVGAVVDVVDDADEAVVVEAVVAPLPREVPLWFGLLRAWLTEHFRGVSVRHLARYLREYVARFGRVATRRPCPTSGRS